MDMRRRRRRLPGEGEDDGGESAAEGAGLADGEGEEQLALEDGEKEDLQGPVGRPTSLGPVAPLFSPKQLRDLHEVQSQAPHLYAKVPRESVWRPGAGMQDPGQQPPVYNDRDSISLACSWTRIWRTSKRPFFGAAWPLGAGT